MGRWLLQTGSTSSGKQFNSAQVKPLPSPPPFLSCKAARMGWDPSFQLSVRCCRALSPLQRIEASNSPGRSCRSNDSGQDAPHPSNTSAPLLLLIENHLQSKRMPMHNSTTQPKFHNLQERSSTTGYRWLTCVPQRQAGCQGKARTRTVMQG